MAGASVLERRKELELFREDIRDVRRRYSAKEGVDILDEAMSAGAVLLKEMARGGKPYIVDDDLLKAEGRFGKYVKATGEKHVAAEVDEDKGDAAYVATHEEMHKLLARYDKPGKKHEEADTESLTSFVLEVLQEDADPGVAELAKRGYVSGGIHQLTRYVNSDGGLGSLGERYLEAKAGGGKGTVEVLIEGAAGVVKAVEKAGRWTANGFLKSYIGGGVDETPGMGTWLENFLKAWWGDYKKAEEERQEERKKKEKKAGAVKPQPAGKP